MPFGHNRTRRRQATGGCGGRGGAYEPAATGGGVRPEEVRREVKRLEDERLRLAPEVTGGDPAAVAEDQRLEKRIRELAITERERPSGRPDPTSSGRHGAATTRAKREAGGAARDECRHARRDHVRDIAHRRGPLRVPVRARGPLPGLGRRLV